MSIKRSLIPAISLFVVTVLSGFVLASSSVSATDDSSVDEVNITVPISCTMSGSGMTSHVASIANGTYNSNIGETTIIAFCNDNSGFAIYAIGYTDDEYGNTDLVGENTGEVIETGSDVTGEFEVSNWSMKLSTDSNADYPIDIETGYDDFIEVPPAYDLVASRSSGTDVGNSAVGASLTATYAAFVDRIQPADIYNGQVKYTLVHPASADEPLPPTRISLDVEKTVSGHGTGDEIEYVITVTNIGDYDAEDVVISIPELEEQFTIQTLTAGDSEENSTSQFISADDVATGYVVVHINATARNTNTIEDTFITEAYESGPPIIDDF